MDSNRVLTRLPALIKAKRREKGGGLRKAAEESGISASTLSRLERGVSPTLPDTETLTKLATWLNVSLNDLVGDKPTTNGISPELSTVEKIEVHLRADKDLSPDTAKALADMFKILYQQFTSNK